MIADVGVMPCQFRPSIPFLSANCPEGWIGLGESCFRISDSELNWFEAVSACQKMSPGNGTGSPQLASCFTQEDLTFVKNGRLWEGANLWVGLTDL